MKQEKKPHRRPWIKRRHRLVRNLIALFLGRYIRRKYHIEIEPFPEGGREPHLILYNHQTAFDQFFVGLSFSGPVYYLASEDLFSMGLVSRLIRFLVAPIPIKKQTADIGAIKDCLRVAREGGTLAIAPEGNRTFSGKTEHMNETIAPLARRLGLPIALFRIEGGYGVHPRWADDVREGRMTAGVVRVLRPEEYDAMSDGELFSAIREGLTVNEARDTGCYRSRRRAEHLERLLYVCPACGLSRFESRGSLVRCLGCGLFAEYREDKSLRFSREDVFGARPPFRYVNDWYEYQNEYLSGASLPEGERLYREEARLSRVILRKRKKRLEARAEVSLYPEKIEIGGKRHTLSLPFSSLTAVTVLGKNKLNLYFGKEVYQLKGGAPFNAVKYVNLFHRYQNRQGEHDHGKFLGL